MIRDFLAHLEEDSANTPRKRNLRLTAIRSFMQRARGACPTLAQKRVSPHVLRHTCAMNSVQATRDIRKVALGLGDTSLKSTEIYLQADPTESFRRSRPPCHQTSVAGPSRSKIASSPGSPARSYQK